MYPDTQITEQIAPYQPWLIIAGVFLLFFLLRVTRKALRQRVDEVGYRLFHEKGLMIWFWLNAPGVIIHELSHALVVLLFTPFGFRITSITLFGIKPMGQRNVNGRMIRRGGPQSLQLGEVQYVRPQGQLMSYVGDGLSGIAPLFGGTAVFAFLYWVATGYSIWDIPLHASLQQIQLLRAGWPWWTLTFAPYLILTITSELWPSRQDWHGARWFVGSLIALVVLIFAALWYFQQLGGLLLITTFVASRIDFALVILVLLDIIFLLAAEALVRMVR
ncbi:MAG TPA: hypothetical protein VL461_02295 [Dictyobacter sp.]|jgi:hypothetical protein|nr:hypothetical protein [Dictyobacter sp.]